MCAVLCVNFQCVFFFSLNVYLFLRMQAIHLKPSSALREPYSKVPFPIDFRVYMFNLTNEEEVIAGMF